MISATLKQRKRAEELEQVWESYFPTLPVGSEYWMVCLEDLPFGVLIKGIKHTARKRVQLRGHMTLEQMFAYLESSCNLTLKEEIAAGIYPADQFKNVSLIKVAPATSPINATATVTNTERTEINGNR
jgi:hypothetical protein